MNEIKAMNEPIEREQSEFNSSIAYLNRINIYLALAGESMYNMDAYSWCLALGNVFKELSTKMQERERTDAEEKYYRLLEASTASQAHKGGINKRLFKELMGFELNLRAVAKESGLETKAKEDARTSLIGIER